MCQTCHVTVHMDSCPDRLTSRCSSDAVFEVRMYSMSQIIMLLTCQLRKSDVAHFSLVAQTL